MVISSGLAVDFLLVHQKSIGKVQPEMPGQAAETHWKFTAPARQKIFCSDYPKSDGVWPESAQKSSGIIKTSGLAQMWAGGTYRGA